LRLGKVTGSVHPLNRPLPSDVAAGESPFIQYYQKYAVFSWPWAWRRTAMFGIVAVLAAASFGTSHGLTVRDAWDAVVVGAAIAVANITLIGAGPMLGALVRHAGWSRRVEGIFIVAAVICGMAVAALVWMWGQSFHDRHMEMYGMGHSSCSACDSVPTSHPDSHHFVRQALTMSSDLFILLVASGGLALSAYFAEPKRWAEHWRRVELEKMSLQKSEADLRLAVLQAQVEPHFLFNTLASVRSLVSSDPPRAAQTIDALAQHLRATLPKLRAEAGGLQSTLGEQFAICTSYLDLMRVRLGERLQVDVRLPPELRDVSFPPLLLISLVENAVKHGVEPKPGVTRVVLAARVIENDGQKQIEVRVEDDGAGLKLGMGEGTGLANIRAQLRTRFASAASLELSERASGGVLARLVLPLETPQT
jgi:Histidine kinase